MAGAIIDGSLRLDSLKKMDDHQARRELLRTTGIGQWTADIYLLLALRRPDIWPTGDLALAAAAQQLKRLKSPPSPEMLEILGKTWKPWRAVAARILWHYYLSRLA